VSPPPETAAVFSSNADAPRSLKLETATETDARCVNKLKRGRSGPTPNNNSPSRPAGDAVYHAHVGWCLACPGGERGAGSTSTRCVTARGEAAVEIREGADSGDTYNLRRRICAWVCIAGRGSEFILARSVVCLRKYMLVSVNPLLYNHALLLQKT
jgi:hypothetical protein